MREFITLGSLQFNKHISFWGHYKKKILTVIFADHHKMLFQAFLLKTLLSERFLLVIKPNEDQKPGVFFLWRLYFLPIKLTVIP